MAGALVAPVALSAQQSDTSATRTHVVRAGETLWRIAQTYLGDGHRWREVLELNADLVTGPSELPVGATIRLPVAGARRTAAPAGPARSSATPRTNPQSTTTPRSAAPTPTATSQQRVPVRSQEPPPAAATPQRQAGESARTIFFRRRSPGSFVESDTGATAERVQDPPPAVRAFEAAAAPFLVDSAFLASAGHCLGVEEARADSVAGHSGASLLERLTIVPPAGAAVDTTSRFLLTRHGPALPGGTIVIPTAIVRVREPGQPVKADIVAQFDVVSCSDQVVPLNLPATGGTVRPRSVSSGPAGSVLWVARESLLPTLQHYVLLDLGTVAGVRPGDQVTVFDPANPDAPAAVTTIVRAGERSSTAVIIDQTRATIVSGAPARVTAKLP